MGAFKGVAHLGAIQALKEADVRIDCVVGNSMGAVVGALYASAPTADTTVRFRQFVEAYSAETERAVRRRATETGLLFGIIGLAFGGIGALAGSVLGAGIGAGSATRMDHARMMTVLDRELDYAEFRVLPIRLVTFHMELGPESERVLILPSNTGSVAQAVGDSVANPFIFENIDPRTRRALDPGADRVAATPVYDACRMFPRARILAINVTGQPVFRVAGMPCPVLEVDAYPGSVNSSEIMFFGPEFDRVFAIGYQATSRALRRADRRWRTEPRSGSRGAGSAIGGTVVQAGNRS